MALSQARRIEGWLLAADVALLVGWCIVSHHFPISLMTTLGVVTAVAWFLGIVTVGGQNTVLLHPRYRILVSMGLALLFAAVVGIFWAGSGHTWYMKGGLHSLVALAVAGTAVRFLLAALLLRPAMQLVPCHVPQHLQSLLDEIANHPAVFLESPLQHPTDALPDRRAGYPSFMVVTDLRLRAHDFQDFMPLYAQVEVVDVCELYEQLLGKVPVVRTEEGWMLPQALRVPSPVREVLKRTFDTVLVLATAPLSLALVALAAMAIKLTSRGPVFYRQTRLGRNGTPFQLIKLRTMAVDAESIGPQWSSGRDPRVTPVGRLLRALGFDELPQLWNVLQGEMALVGPRPERPEIIAGLEAQIPFYRLRLLAAPGLTGWAQLHQGGDVTVNDVANKLRYDLYYLKYGTLALDLRILLGTLQLLLHLAKPAPRTTPDHRVPTA
jgi:lipopolysaccharide/colanic/teichoic acid biosynthesis glycosyltransferase